MQLNKLQLRKNSSKSGIKMYSPGSLRNCSGVGVGVKVSFNV